MGRQKVYLDKLARFFQIRHLLLRQALAECLGTLILVVSVCGCRSVWMYETYIASSHVEIDNQKQKMLRCK